MKLNKFPAHFYGGSTRNFKPAGSMLRNIFGSHVPSEILLLEDVQSMQITKIWFIGSMPLER
jgi:hypothetical protein